MDWRKDFLYIVEDTVGYSFQKKSFLTTKDNDHSHCAICWEKIGCSDDVKQVGYYCKANSYWLCCKCFFDFKKQYKWKEDNRTIRDNSPCVPGGDDFTGASVYD